MDHGSLHSPLFALSLSVSLSFPLTFLSAANVAVADVTDRTYQATLFYHLGLRESFDMKNNVVTYVDEQASYRAGRRGSAVSEHNVSFSVSCTYVKCTLL